MVKRGLGKGINSLIGDYTLSHIAGADDSKAVQDGEGPVVVMLSISKIESNPGQPRKNFDDG